MLKKSILTAAIFCGVFLFQGFFSTQVQALSIDFPKYYVKMTVNEDSSMDVEETLTHRFIGEGHGLRRDVTIKDPFLTARCESNINLSCGGFDHIVVVGATDKNGKELTEDDGYSTYLFTDTTGKEFLRFEWELWPDGKSLNGESVTWTVKYKVYGSLKWLNPGGINSSNSANRESVPYLYWNALAEDRSGIVEDAKVEIFFPKSVAIDPKNLITYTDYSSNYEVNSEENSILLKLNQTLSAYGAYTVAYEFKIGEITKPASLTYSISPYMISTKVFFDDILISTSKSDTLLNIPSGKKKLMVEAFGFKDEVIDLDLAEGEDKTIKIEMTRTPLMQTIYYLSIGFMLFGFCILTPFTPVYAYLKYRSKGRDKYIPKTIIPLFSPPEGVSPYLLGSIKDEKVDKEDIVGTIIDLAYRGFIKIKEVKKGKNYELTKLDGKKDSKALNEIEKEILEAIFNGKQTIETKDMRTYFPLKYTQIVNSIYGEMVKDGYFENSPRFTRGMYLGYGIVLISIGIGLVGFGSTFISNILNFIFVFTPGIAIALLGVIYLPLAFYMPAKSEKGGRTYADILGFKMYLHTAERFRLQNLGPEEFEKYLSYAVVFKMEEEWAKKFEGIYEGHPDWYQGTGNIYDAMLISSLTRDFTKAATVAATPISSGSSSRGGGWSGGGSFGGSSGGGGGGGGAGGW